MILFDLKCQAQGHVFEGWFGTGADYEDQRARGLLTCPLCGDGDVSKAVMAPAVATKGNRRPSRQDLALQPSAAVATGGDEARMQALMDGLAQAQKKALEGSTWVGRGFAEQARAMHYGEQPHRGIHGEVAPQEAKALIAEGVDVAPLPFPVIPPEAKN